MRLVGGVGGGGDTAKYSVENNHLIAKVGEAGPWPHPLLLPREYEVESLKKQVDTLKSTIEKEQEKASDLEIKSK